MMGDTLKFILWVLVIDCIFASTLRSINNQIGDAPFTGGYKYYGDLGYYKLYALPVTWGYAWKQCTADGGHLVVIDSNEEHNIVMDIVKEGKQEIYIGVHDMFVEGWFCTVTGGVFTPSEGLTWASGEPNNYNEKENCVVLRPNGLLNDVECSKEHYFICEHKQNPSFPLIPKLMNKPEETLHKA